MNKYESIIIIKPDLLENDTKKIIDRIENLVNEFTVINKDELEVEDLGKRKLAYEVRGYKEGRYVIFTFCAEEENILELARTYRITDEIIKFLTVRKDV